jgi:hypothetical protein
MCNARLLHPPKTCILRFTDRDNMVDLMKGDAPLSLKQVVVIDGKKNAFKVLLKL